jgi:hypothetical protein
MNDGLVGGTPLEIVIADEVHVAFFCLVLAMAWPISATPSAAIPAIHFA